MATIGDLYRQARELRNQRKALKPTKEIRLEIWHLDKIMAGLMAAYLQAGGSKAPDPETP